jgi:poly [ADP-ribose] polymerase
MADNLQQIYLVKVEPGENNNKYYFLNPDGDYFNVKFGRIGVTGYQTARYPISKWKSKLNEKLKKGYVDQTRLVAQPITIEKKKYKDLEDTNINAIVLRLQTMAKQAIQENYTITSNKVTQIMIDEAQNTINILINTSELKQFNTTLVELFKIIPRKMGKVVNYLATTNTDYITILQREQDLLDVMRGQVIQNIVEQQDIADTPQQTILEAMGLCFTSTTDEQNEIIKENLGNIKNKFYQAWVVKNNKTQLKFDFFIKNNNISNTKLLWHGSRNENFWSIINLGLVLRPNAIITGKLYGHGIYFAPKAQKSIGYTSINGSYWANGTSPSGFMALFNVAYGKPYDVYNFDNRYHTLNYENLQKIDLKANCLHAHAGANMGSSSLKNDEIIIYKEDQCTINYLVELR